MLDRVYCSVQTVVDLFRDHVSLCEQNFISETKAQPHQQQHRITTKLQSDFRHRLLSLP
jgi:hypothetical protein